MPAKVLSSVTTFPIRLITNSRKEIFVNIIDSLIYMICMLFCRKIVFISLNLEILKTFKNWLWCQQRLNHFVDETIWLPHYSRLHSVSKESFGLTIELLSLVLQKVHLDKVGTHNHWQLLELFPKLSALISFFYFGKYRPLYLAYSLVNAITLHVRRFSDIEL